MDDESSTTDHRIAEISNAPPPASHRRRGPAGSCESPRERRRDDALRCDSGTPQQSASMPLDDGDEAAHALRLEDLLEDFLAEHTAATAACYRRDLRHVALHLETCGTDLLRARRSELTRYVRASELGETASATINRRLAALSGFYAYLVSQGVLDRAAVTGLRRPRGRHAPRLGISAVEIARLLTVARAAGPEAELLVSLLALCGLRVSEALGIDDTDLSRTDGGGAVVVSAVVVRRKGGHSELVGLPRVVGELFAAVRATKDPGPIFRGRRGGRLSRQVAWRELRHLGRLAGIDDALYPHLLRHSFVSCALLAGVPVPIVAAGAGHRDPQTCLRYAQALEALGARAATVVAQVVADARSGSG